MTCVYRSVGVLKQHCDTQGTDGARANPTLNVSQMAGSVAPTAEAVSESSDLPGKASAPTLV